MLENLVGYNMTLFFFECSFFLYSQDPPYILRSFLILSVFIMITGREQNIKYTF